MPGHGDKNEFTSCIGFAHSSAHLVFSPPQTVFSLFKIPSLPFPLPDFQNFNDDQVDHAKTESALNVNTRYGNEPTASRGSQPPDSCTWPRPAYAFVTWPGGLLYWLAVVCVQFHNCCGASEMMLVETRSSSL